MDRRTRLRVVAGLVGLVAVSLALRTGGLDTGFWIDEGLSVGIADRPLTDIPGTLRLDGSPPLYYMLLHVWLAVAGRSEEATHVLSLLFALATIPVAFLLLRAPFGERTAWCAAALAAVNPFLTIYAQETRMYALVILLSLIACAAFARAFVLGERRWIAVFAVALAALMYTHNWALFFAVATGLTWLVLLAVSAERRALLRDGVLGFGGALVLFAPWIPSLLFQAAHTGAPWAKAPTLNGLVAVPERFLGETGLAVVALAAGAGLIALGKGARERRAAAALLGIGVVTLAIAWTASQANPAWAVRYFSVALPPFLLVTAIGLAHARRLGLVALALVCVLHAADAPPPRKSNARDVAREVGPMLRPGDLVIATQPEQVPVLSYYLPEGLRYATLTGALDDLGVTDWRDGTERLRATGVEEDLRPLLDALEPGRRLAVMVPIVYDLERWSAPWTSLVRLRSDEWLRFVKRDRRFRVVALAPGWPYPPEPNPVRATVFVKDRMR